MPLSRVNVLVTTRISGPCLLAILCFCFVGCSSLNTTESDSEKPLVLWHAYESGGTEHRFLQESLARYQALHPDIRVKTVAVPFEPFANKISVSVPRGNGPDAFIFAHDAVGDWAAKGLVEPIGLWVEPKDLDSMHRTALAAFVYEGELYGMPTTAKTLALYYSPKVVKTPAKTTDELRRQIRNYRQRNPAGVGLAYDIDDLFFHAPWFFGFGGVLIQENQLVFDRAPFVNGFVSSLKLIRDWVADGIVPTDTNYDSVKEKFKRGEVAYVLSGPWFSTDLPPGSFGISTLPRISEANGAFAKPFMTVEGLYVSRFSKRKAKAMALVQFLASQAEANARKVATGDLVTRTDTGEALTESMRVFQTQLKHAQPTPNVPLMKSLWSPLNRVLAEVLKREVKPEEAIREARLLIERGGGTP